MTEQRKIIMTEGSKYRIQSIGKRDEFIITEGTFIGYTRIGSDEALCIELAGKKGGLRILPIHMILSMDIISEMAPEPRKDSKKTDSSFETPTSYFR